jgi:N utilization substance protein B
MSASRTASLRRRRTAARLAAVQALYEMEVADVTADAVLEDVGRRRLPTVNNGEEGTFVEPDTAFLAELVHGVVSEGEAIDRHLSAALTGRLTLDRLEVLLRAILRTGAYEMLAMPGVPAKVVITEYLELAHAFFAGKEPPLVNAVLDRLAQRLRPRDDGT